MSVSDQTRILATDKDAAAKERPFIIRAGKKLRNAVNRLSGRQSLIPVDPVLDSSYFDWASLFRENADAIAEEAHELLAHRQAIPPLKDISPDHAQIARDGLWRSFFLYGYGLEISENCERAPRTAALVRKIPNLNSAFFSILAPGAVIPPHRGVTRGIVTCHFGIDVPKDTRKCWMRVEDQIVHWKSGDWLIFDDSVEHEVANETDEERVILLVQVKRPMRFIGKLVNNMAIWGIRKSPFVQEAKTNLVHWEKILRRSEDKSASRAKN